MNSSTPDWVELVDPVVRGIVGRKFRASLSKQDPRRSNQKALDTVQNVYLELTKALGNPGEIIDLKSFAAKVSYTESAKTMRAWFPDRTKLANKVRYFLSHEPGFAVWEDEDGDVHCGFAGWKAKPPAPAQVVNALIMDPGQTSAKVSFQTKSLESMKAVDWRNLMEGMFQFLGAPAALDDVVAIAVSIFRVKDEPQPGPTDPSGMPGTEDWIFLQAVFQRLWQILQDFEHRWLMAFLLNLPGYTKEARGEIEAFENTGAATRQDLGRLLALTDQEYRALSGGKPELPADPGSPESRMAVVWPHLPLEDALIAKALDCQKQQVINLRDVARQKAAKRLKDMLANKTN